MAQFLDQMLYRARRALPLASGCMATMVLAYLVFGLIGLPAGAKQHVALLATAFLQGLPFFLGATLGVAAGHRTSKLGEFMVGLFSGLVVLLLGALASLGLLLTGVPGGVYLAPFAPLVIAASCGIGVGAWLTRAGRSRGRAGAGT